MEPPIAEPPADPKKLKRMKKKLDELNRKIRHSRKKHDGLIHKQNSLRKAIEELKRGNAKQPTIKPAQGFVEHERDFGRAYSSLRVAPSIKDERVYAIATKSLLQERK